MRLLIQAIALLATSACVPSGEAEIEPTPYPFVGMWDCEVATFTFEETTYNNGSETLPIENIVPRDNSFVLSFADNYSITLDMNGTDRMQWLSGTTGDAFDCARL